MIPKNTPPNTLIVRKTIEPEWGILNHKLPYLHEGDVFTVKSIVEDCGGVNLFETKTHHEVIHTYKGRRFHFVYSIENFILLTLPSELTDLLKEEKIEQYKKKFEKELVE